MLNNIGQLGAQLYVRKLSGMFNPGYRAVSPVAEFIAGTVAKVVADASGNPVATPVTAVTDTPVGIFMVDKTVSFYKTVYDATVELGAAGVAVNLPDVKLKSGTVRVTTDAGAPVVEASNYTIDLVHGTITPTAAGLLDGEAACLISYWAEDGKKIGLDSTMGSGKVTTLEGIGELATLVYDTSVTYTLGDGIYFTAEGVLTSVSGGSAVKIGSITKVPTASDPELYVKVTL